MRKGQKVNRIMSVAERERLTADIEEKKGFKEAAESNDLAPGIMGPIGNLGSRSVDTSALEAEIRHKQRILEAGTPERISGAKRQQAEVRRKELAEELGKRLLTHKEMDLMPKHGYEYHRAVRKTSDPRHGEIGSVETQSMMREYRQISAQLDPDNPEAQSIEALRRDH